MRPSVSATAEASALAVLIARLQNAGVDWDGENVADLLWLASYLDPPTPPNDSTGAPAEKRDSVRVEIDDSAPAPLPEISPTLSLSMPQPSRSEKEAASKPRRGIPFQTPTAPALRNRLEIGRSLRPLMRKVESYTNQVLDEAATAELTAQQQFCMPVMRPERERWLELALVIEDSASSFLWREVIREFRQVLEHQGAFRTVTTWYLKPTSASGIQLFAQRPQGAVMPRPRSPKELLESSGRRLIFFISDCISPAWQQEELAKNYLALWAKHGPVVIVQMLPARLWHRTALVEGERVPFFARSPGVPNAQLLSPALSKDTNVDRGLKLPIITVEPASMAQWARLIAGFGDASAAGVWFEPDWQVQAEDLEALMAASTGGSAALPAKNEDVAAVAALVRSFSTTASDMARELAALMALVPVDLSLVYIIQTKLLPDSSPLHVAEVFLSGLVERVKDDNPEDNGAEADSETGGSFFATRRRYDFVPGVRNILIDSVDIPSAEAVLNEISAYICERLNRSTRNFTALLRLGDELDAEGEEFAEFARVTKQALRRLGGEYAALVEDIEQPPVPPPGTYLVSFPPWELLAFEKGELIDSERLGDSGFDSDVAAFPPLLKTASFQVAIIRLPQQTLETFEFQTAKIEQERAGIFRRLQWVVKKSRGQARRFVEPLADDLTLEMVAILGGTFIMGSPENEPERSPDEGPQHEVTVPDFFMGRYPVTQAQWQFVANLPQVKRELNPYPSRFRGSHLPVEQVSWDDVIEFCDRLSTHTDRTYRLPTEAEWEYACRAGTTTPFHFGEMILPDVANYNGGYTYADGPKGKNRQKTTSVDEFNLANAFGLSDMHGNVWEWCQDHYGSYDKTPRDGSAWITDKKEANRSLRGGSWLINPRYCRSAQRDDFTPDFRDYFIGFRVSCSAPRT